MIPFKLDSSEMSDDMTYFIGISQWFDASDGRFEVHFKDLAKHLRLSLSNRSHIVESAVKAKSHLSENSEPSSPDHHSESPVAATLVAQAKTRKKAAKKTPVAKVKTFEESAKEEPVLDEARTNDEPSGGIAVAERESAEKPTEDEPAKQTSVAEGILNEGLAPETSAADKVKTAEAPVAETSIAEAKTEEPVVEISVADATSDEEPVVATSVALAKPDEEPVTETAAALTKPDEESVTETSVALTKPDEEPVSEISVALTKPDEEPVVETSVADKKTAANPSAELGQDRPKGSPEADVTEEAQLLSSTVFARDRETAAKNTQEIAALLNQPELCNKVYRRGDNWETRLNELPCHVDQWTYSLKIAENIAFLIDDEIEISQANFFAILDNGNVQLMPGSQYRVEFEGVEARARRNTKSINRLMMKDDLIQERVLDGCVTEFLPLHLEGPVCVIDKIANCSGRSAFFYNDHGLKYISLSDFEKLPHHDAHTLNDRNVGSETSSTTSADAPNRNLWLVAGIGLAVIIFGLVAGNYSLQHRTKLTTRLGSSEVGIDKKGGSEKVTETSILEHNSHTEKGNRDALDTLLSGNTLTADQVGGSAFLASLNDINKQRYQSPTQRLASLNIAIRGQKVPEEYRGRIFIFLVASSLCLPHSHLTDAAVKQVAVLPHVGETLIAVCRYFPDPDIRQNGLQALSWLPPDMLKSFEPDIRPLAEELGNGRLKSELLASFDSTTATTDPEELRRLGFREFASGNIKQASCAFAAAYKDLPNDQQLKLLTSNYFSARQAQSFAQCKGYQRTQWLFNLAVDIRHGLGLKRSDFGDDLITIPWEVCGSFLKDDRTDRNSAQQALIKTRLNHYPQFALLAAVECLDNPDDLEAIRVVLPRVLATKKSNLQLAASKLLELQQRLSDAGESDLAKSISDKIK